MTNDEILNMKNGKTINIDPLISLYENTYKETLRIKNLLWKLLGWTCGIIYSTILAFGLISVPPGYEFLFKFIFILFATFVAFLGKKHIDFAHNDFINNMGVMRKIELIFNFHKDNYYTSEAILPKEWRGTYIPVSKREIIFKYRPFLIWIVLVFTCYSIIFINTKPSNYEKDTAFKIAIEAKNNELNQCSQRVHELEVKLNKMETENAKLKKDSLWQKLWN